MPLEIRPPSAVEVRLLQSIEDAADSVFLERFRPARWWPAIAGEERAASRGFLRVAAVSGRDGPVGFVHVVEVDGLAHLDQLSVLPEHARHGVGRALMEAALAEAAARGHRRMTLRTYADVPWNAPFYARSGFVESDPDEPFLHDLVAAEERLELRRYGRRIQMTADLGSPR